MVVQLYTMRVVLNALGVEDYGIYNVVAGVVVLFNFLTVTMSGATSRFLTYEMGVGNQVRIEETFRTALFLHICIAVALIVIAETVGLWFVCNKLVIPESRKVAAEIVYQISIITIAIKTIQVPFNASIIANERMDIYAKVEIANVIITLGGVFLLQTWSGDRLIFYALLLTVIALATTLFYSVFCIYKFRECSWNIHYSKRMVKELVAFSGWDLYGNFCVTARIQGINIILNMFFGPMVNAATAVSSSVQTAIISFGSNVITAFRPQIIKRYAAKEYAEMENLVGYALKFSLLLFAIIAVPIFIEMPFVLKLWLKTPPEYAISLTRISLIAGLVSFATSVLNILIHATGDIKWLSFISGTIFLMILPISYFALHVWKVPETAYVVTLILVTLNVCVALVIVKKQLPTFGVRKLILKSLLPTFLVIISAFIACTFISTLVRDGLLQVVTNVLISTTVICSLSIMFLIPRAILRAYLWKLKAKIH